MPEALPGLEMQRAAIQQQIAQLGDMRAGSITTTGGRCGNPRCHCHEKDDPGHGPFYRLTRKVDGKTVPRPFPFQRPFVRPKKKSRSIIAFGI